jgi:hypothetical protein
MFSTIFSDCGIYIFFQLCRVTLPVKSQRSIQHTVNVYLLPCAANYPKYPVTATYKYAYLLDGLMTKQITDLH